MGVGQDECRANELYEGLKMTESEREILREVMVRSYKKLEKVEVTDYIANIICQLYMALHNPRDKQVVLSILAGHLGVAPPGVQQEIKLEPVIKPRGEFATLLLEDRMRKGITQKKYAQSLKVREGLYSYWERGEGVPHTQHLHAISEVTKTEVAELLRLMREFVTPHMQKKMGESK